MVIPLSNWRLEMYFPEIGLFLGPTLTYPPTFEIARGYLG